MSRDLGFHSEPLTLASQSHMGTVVNVSSMDAGNTLMKIPVDKVLFRLAQQSSLDFGFTPVTFIFIPCLILRGSVWIRKSILNPPNKTIAQGMMALSIVKTIRGIIGNHLFCQSCFFLPSRLWNFKRQGLSLLHLFMSPAHTVELTLTEKLLCVGYCSGWMNKTLPLKDLIGWRETQNHVKLTELQGPYRGQLHSWCKPMSMSFGRPGKGRKEVFRETFPVESMLTKWEASVHID